MPEPREARAIIESAEQAAAAGNYSAAEALLGEAAALQEQTLGPQHPDLANTLNNLGVVCEIADNPIDAEHYFRRAYAIATVALAPDHPFVATSRKNLHDFCAARGRPVELPPSPPQVAAWLEASAPRTAPAPETPPPATPTPVAESTPASSPRTLAFAGVGIVAVLAAVLVMTRLWGTSVEETEPAPVAATAPAPAAPAATPETPSPAAPVATPEPAAAPVETTRREPDPVSDTTKADAAAAPAAAATAPTVVIAQLCTALAAWRCETANGDVPAGTVSFYTQVKSATATTIEHRWYQGDRLHRAMQLRIQANPGAGYRTYSRTTVSGAPGAGWRVELRSADGVVLHEERFTIR